MQATNELVLGYLAHLKESGLNYDKDTLDVAINCLQDAFRIEAAAPSAELLALVEGARPEAQVASAALKDAGNAAMAAGEHGKADGLYTQAIEQSRRRGEPLEQRCVYYANRAAARKALGQVDAAVEDLRQALELNPAYQKGWLRLAALHEERGDPAAALAIYRQQHEKAPCAQTEEALARLQPPAAGASAEELAQQFPMLGEALNDPAVKELLKSPSVQAKLAQMKANPMLMVQMLGDPEMKPLMGAIMKNLGPMMGNMMGGAGMDFGKMFGGQ